MEKWGMARQDSGVHLYSRKVLIQSRCETLLPEWMRFLKGVVDSEDLPLNISRESMQDSALMRKLSTVLAKRVVKFLVERAKVDHDAYLTFYQEKKGMKYQVKSYLKIKICLILRPKKEHTKEYFWLSNIH